MAYYKTETVSNLTVKKINYKKAGLHKTYNNILSNVMNLVYPLHYSA